MALLSALVPLVLLTGCRSDKAPDETDTTVITDTTAAAPAPTETDPETTAEPGETLYFDDGIREETAVETTAQSGKHYEFHQDFGKPISPNNPDWFINDVADLSGGNLTSQGKTHFYVATKHKINAEKSYISLSLQSDRPAAPPHDSGYVGLRMQNFDNQFNAVGNNGIWLAFQNNRVGIISTWPNVPLFEVPYSFAEPSVIDIEDDMENNIISVFGHKDGERLLLFRVIIEDQHTVTVVDAGGKTQHTANFPYDIDNTGYVCFWAHQNQGNVVYDDVSVSWDEHFDAPYVPGDPTDMQDLYSDGWVAVDGANRPVKPTGQSVDDKLVGIFYEIWNVGTHVTYPDQLLYDHNAIYQEGGVPALEQAVGAGPLGWGHWWAEPYFGYYLATDRWIIRKHASMLADIGVDFIYLDVTNGNPFTGVYKTIFKEYRAMRDEGLRTPDICFFLNDNPVPNVKVFDDLWDNLYSTGKYSDLYCMYKGKPLILGNLAKVDPEKAEHFTVRRCWALKENLGDGQDYWNWMCETPQVAAYNSKTGEIEEISISAGFLANLSIGRSWTVEGGQPRLTRLPNGNLDKFQFNLPSTAIGPMFAEQMQRAAEVDPYVMLVTGWNEWTAGRWETTGSGGLIANSYLTGSGPEWTKSYYVDAFNPEFSRDIEPMKGGFGDNYYYQLAAFLREFKGARDLPGASGQQDMPMDGHDAAWDSVWPEYHDSIGDTFHRDSIGAHGFHYYTNDSGRNDLVSVKVSRGQEFTYFRAVCAAPITAPEGSQWMNLFLNSDGRYDTGWAGYDYLIGRDVSGISGSAGTVSVERFTNNGWTFESVGTAEIRIDGDTLVLKVPTALCGLSGDFDFKWADNSVNDGEVMEFLDMGDAAPNARFNYAYRSEGGTAHLTGSLVPYIGEQNGAGFRVGSSYMVAGDRMHTLNPASTRTQTEMAHGRICVPAKALANAMGMTVDIRDDGKTAAITYNGRTALFREGDTTVTAGADTIIIPVAAYLSGDQLYVPLNAVAFALDLHYEANEAGVALITARDITETGEALDKLLRALGRSV